MTDYIVPSVGTSGTFTLKQPFDSLISASSVYTARSVRLIGDCIANNEDILNEVYIANGLTEAVYAAELAENVYIVTLSGSDGKTIIVPVSYITAYPVTSGVKYANMMLGISVGALPESFDFDVLIEQLSNMVKDSIGVIPTIKPVQLSNTSLVTYDDDAQLKAAREAIINLKTTDSAKLKVALASIESYKQQIADLEAYIVSKTP